MAEGRMRLNHENEILRLLFCIVFGFHYLWSSAEGRMRLNHENKIPCLLFCIVFGFHYLCTSISTSWQTKWPDDQLKRADMNDSYTTAADKHGLYKEVNAQIRGLIEGEDNLVGVLANISAALRTAFGERFFWVGFYLVRDKELILGPFQGTVACTHIAYGRGVCGTAWQRDTTLVVDDVEQFAGHIACSSLSRSEIVVPLHRSDGSVACVLDIDSTALSAFDDTDREGLEDICQLLTPLFE